MDELDILQKALSDAPSVSQIARDAKVAVRTANAVKTSENPGIRTAIKLARAAGLEFYVGPPRDSQDLNPALDNSEITPILGLPPEASADEILAAITALVERAERTGGDNDRWDQDQVQAELAALREAIGDLAAKEPPQDAQGESRWAKVADKSNVYRLAPMDADDDDVAPGARAAVEVMELRAAAGSGAEVLDETVVGRIWFQRDWLDARAIDPTQAVIIGVRGESMEPTLPDGCSILVDRSRRRRRNDHIYVLRTGDGIVVKRLARSADGWQVVSDHPAWETIAWPDDAEVIGEVGWMLRSVL